jgi:hypothetical protein
MNTTHETTDKELAEMLHELSRPQLLIISIVIDFFRVRHWLERTARRFSAWMAGKK